MHDIILYREHNVLQNIIQHAAVIMAAIDRYSEALGKSLAATRDFGSENIGRLSSE